MLMFQDTFLKHKNTEFMHVNGLYTSVTAPFFPKKLGTLEKHFPGLRYKSCYQGAKTYKQNSQTLKFFSDLQKVFI